MRSFLFLITVTLFSGVVLLGFAPRVMAQEPGSSPEIVSAVSLPDAPDPQNTSSSTSSQQTQPGRPQSAQQPQSDATPMHTPPPQPKRILGLMPNYRAVSAGTKPPPPTSREAFMIATRNSFDYSAFVFVGVTSLMAEGSNSHPQLGKGVPGYWAYSWRGFLDKTDGNYFVDWAMPTVFHQDERYYAMGEGGVWKRGVYSATRVIITPNYHGKNGFNTSEMLGRGISEAISLTYYPSNTQTASGFAEKYAYAIGRDTLTNVIREFWPRHQCPCHSPPSLIVL